MPAYAPRFNPGDRVVCRHGEPELRLHENSVYVVQYWSPDVRFVYVTDPSGAQLPCSWYPWRFELVADDREAFIKRNRKRREIECPKVNLP